MDVPLINVSTWRVDEEHGIFPIGARDKRMLWSPAEAHAKIRTNWPYLFKRSRPSYPDQFWMETVAWLVGEQLNILVPMALPAVRRSQDEGKTEHGALIEWFYNQESQQFIHASNFFQKLIPDFDDQTGAHHNIKDLILIHSALHGVVNIEPPLQEWLCDMLLFDALIGNSDRHQENWGFIFMMHSSTGQLSPFFDNGTSLGHERFPERIHSWPEDKLNSYIGKGQHHLRKNRDNTQERLFHLESIQWLVDYDDRNKNRMLEKLDFDFEILAKRIKALCAIELAVPFSAERGEWTIRLLKQRHSRIKEILTQ